MNPKVVVPGVEMGDEFKETWSASSSSLKNKAFPKAIISEGHSGSRVVKGYLHALNGLIDKPHENGLNAATAAGIEIARNILSKGH